jgi:PAS domain S-box-containing protein
MSCTSLSGLSTLAAILNLGAGLVVFVTAASLLVLAVGRPEFLGAGSRSRLAIQAGSLMVLAAAVVEGAVVDLDPSTGWAVGLRAGGAVLLALGALGLSNAPARAGLLAAVGFFAAGEAVLLAGPETVGDVLRTAGGVAMGVSAAVAARRSIAVRIAAAAITLLLVVVLVLSAVLSAVITGNIAREALDRSDERARIEAGIVAGQADFVVGQADFLSGALVSSEVLGRALQTGEFEPLQQAIEGFRSDYRQVDFIAFVDSEGKARVGVAVAQTEVVELAGTAVIADALAGNQAGSIDVVGGGLMAVGAAPVQRPDPRGVQELVGVVVTGIRLDGSFLGARLQSQRSTEFSLVTAGRVVATTGEGDATLASVVGEGLQRAVTTSVLSQGRSVRGETDVAGEPAFVAASPVVSGSGRPAAAFVVTQESSLVSDTRASLFRTLFLVALAAAAGAFLFAVAAGTRVAAPLLRLTDAAQRIREGDLSVRAGIEADDELGVLGSSFDTMTDSIERMTREIREAAAQTEAILSGMAEGLVATDARGTVVALNPSAETLLRTKEARAVGRKVDAVIVGTERGGAPLAKRLSAPLRRPWSAHGVLDRGKGSLAVAMSGSPIRNERGQVIGAVYVMRDVQREAEVEAMKTEFLSNISHELRTPLTPIKGYAEMMLTRDVDKPRAQTFLANILEGAERLERYVDMLVNFAAMEAGRFTIHAEEVDLGAVVARIGHHWDSSTQRHRVDVTVRTRLPRVMADERLLERALNELMDNAVKYSPDGGTVEIVARTRGSGSDRRVEVSVADHGIGIEPDALASIFADFSQVDGSSTRKYGGLGLGLSFVDRVVKAHQGTLSATSEPGAGSVFTLSLPPATPHREKPGAKGATTGRAAPRRRRARPTQGRAGARTR